MLEDGCESATCADHVDVVAGRYRLGPVLSRSAGSCAHRAYDKLLQRTVRVTLVTAAVEAPAAFALRPQGWQERDPEIAELFDAGREHDRLFLVTHHPDEPTLAETTPPGGLDLGQLRDLGTAVATALVPRHQRGAAHGGLGAGTVAFTPQGASLAEFGLLPWLARWGDVPVTPPYVAPEQRTGADPGPATDVYALGRLLGELAPDHGLHPGLRTLLAEMTAESPDARPSMAEVQQRLAGRRARRTPPSASLRHRGRRLGLVAAACCLVGLGVGLSAFAGEVPAIGSDGATLAATAAVPAPIIPLGPLLPAPTVAAADDVVSRGTASGHTASAATASAVTASAVTAPARRSASASTGDAGASDGSSRVVDAAQRTSSAPHDRGGSDDADATDAPSHPTTTDRGADTTPSRPSPRTTAPSGDTTRPGHQVHRVLDQVGSTLGHHSGSTSGRSGAGTRTSTSEGAQQTDGHGATQKKSTTVADVLDPTSDS